jgi:predicted secreted protein
MPLTALEASVTARARKVVVLAHCHLNANTKLRGIADYAGARIDVVSPLIADGIGIVQLPCPEATYLGMKRWGMTREQYDTPSFRRHCETLLRPVVDTLVALAEDGCDIQRVIGVDGSPSCGVNRTCAGFFGGEPDEVFSGDDAQICVAASGRGVFMDVFVDLLTEAGLEIRMTGADERI